MKNNKKGITLIALIISIIVLVILAGVAINTLYGENGIITTTQDVTVLSNIKSLEESIDLYKISKNLDGKIEEDSYPIALNEDGSRVTLSQMRNVNELSKLPNEVKYTLLNLTAEKGSTNIPSLDQIDYSKFYKLDYTKLNISEEKAENLVIYVDGDTYKVINLAGVKYKRNNVYVIIPLNNEAEPEYITVANNIYKLYGDGTLKALGEKTVNSGYTTNEVNSINGKLDEFDLKAINARFGNRMSLPETLTADWYASHVYFSKKTAYVIDQNNDLWAWGVNDYNKLGLGNSFLVVEPTKILEGRCEGKENVKASKVWAGDYNTFVVDTDNILWACGQNGQGVLGQGNFNNYNKWVKIDYINGSNVKEIQVTTYSQGSTALIIMQNGEVYGAGINYGQLGSGGKKNVYNKIDSYNGATQVYLGAETSWFIKDNNLYGCGYQSHFGATNNVTVENAIKIADNVKKVKTYADYVTYITDENKLYVFYKNNVKEIANANVNDETVLCDYINFITDDEMYSIMYSEGSIREDGHQSQKLPYYNNYGGYKFVQSKGMYVYITNEGKVYISGNPDITRIEEKSNYNLRNVFENVKFIQGKANYISIVDRGGRIYESISSNYNTSIDNAKKIISSSTSKYVIKEDGTLWAKGDVNTGMWGEYIVKSDYVQVTTDGTEPFTNVKNIFTSSLGYSSIFITKDNKIYWAGADVYISLPKIVGDYEVVGNGRITKYPKEVTSSIIEEIKNKIKDIQYSYINEGGIQGHNTLILTEDGRLYTMSNNKNMSGNNSLKYNDNGDFTELTIKEGTTVKQILTQAGFSLALLSNGEVYGWGYNTYGILGPNYEVGGIYPTPVKLEGLPANIRYMSLGNGFAIFASKSGEVYGIGKNDYGQLGTGDSIGRTEFVRCIKLEE